MHLKMTEEYVDEFVRDNFGSDYVPVLHGQTNSIQPLTLLLKRKRKWWMRPFARSELQVIACLGDFVVAEKREFFTTLKTSILKKEECLQKKEGNPAQRNSHGEIDLRQWAAFQVHFDEERGDLRLGKLREEYYTDPGLRRILIHAILDPELMAPYEEEELQLVTAVVYSDRFELKGNRKYKISLDGSAQAPSLLAQFLGVEATAHYCQLNVPPAGAVRHSSAPFLFKCCPVDYDKDAKRLKVCRGVFVGKNVERSLDSSSDDEDEAITSAEALVLELNVDESSSWRDVSRLTCDEYERINAIEKPLLTVSTTQEQKQIAQRYLKWFEQLLTEGKTHLHIDNPLTKEDCEFLRALYVSAVPNQWFLDLKTIPDKEIQGYGIVFKILCELTDEKWEELKKKLSVMSVK